VIRWLAVVAALALQQPGASPVQVVLGTERRGDFFICIGDQPGR
jgi:hypothetical protein